jgi:hypothetical protein
LAVAEQNSFGDSFRVATRSSIYASLITGGVFYLFAISQYFLGNDPIGLSFLVGFAMVALFWIPVAALGTVLSTIVLMRVPSQSWLPVQLLTFGGIAGSCAILGGSLENRGEVLALPLLGLIFGAVSTYFLKRLSKMRPANG